MPLTPPFVLVDRYEITAEIGRGGHAVVYHARDRVLDREVAVKLLRDDVLSSDTLARFRKEVQVTAQLEHAHILHVYDTGTFEGRPFIVMELASGSTLAARLGREHLLPMIDALQIARDIGLALAHAHARGIVHRDVKPENILLGTGGAILADFGIARVTQEVLTQKITSTGTTVGTVQYMSPEQLCAEPDIDARSDQYSLACVLYEMLAGVRPHMAATFEALRVLRTTGRCEPVRTHRVSVPAAVDDAIARALSPIPADRFRGMDEFLSAIGANASGEFATSGGAGVIARSGGYGAVSGGDGRSPVSVENARGAAARSDASGIPSSGASPLVRRLMSRRVIGSAVAASVVVAAGVFAADSRTRREESAGGLADGAVAVALIGAELRRSDTTSVDARIRGALSAELDSWSGLRVVNRLPSNDSSALTIEPSIGAVGDSVRVRLEIRRAGRATPERIDALVAGDEARRTPALVVATLVRRALVRQASRTLTTTETPGIDAMPDRSMAVLRAYVGGFAALREGKLDSAAASFRVAARSSAKPFAQAEFWAAQSAAWSEPTKPEAWKANIDNAVRAGTLHGVDSLLATALGAMSRGEFPGSCAGYRAATISEPSSFVAWFGLGECQRLDDVVIPTPMGSRFRSSHWAATAAYSVAVQYAATSDWMAALFAPVMRTTYAIGNTSRRGRSQDSAQTLWFALPSLAADTLAFVPVPSTEFWNAGRHSVPSTWLPAMRRGRSVALQVTGAWVKRSPQSSQAWFRRAIALELAGAIDTDGTELSALGALDRAERFDLTNAVRSSIGVARTRLALRRAAFGDAVKLARLTLARVKDNALPADSMLLPLAALLGDVDAAMRARSPMRTMNSSLPQALNDSLAAFAVRATIGECSDLLRLQTHIDSQIAVTSAPAQIAAQRNDLLLTTYRAAVPCIGPHAIDSLNVSFPIDRAFRALANADTIGARRILHSLPGNRAGATIGTITWDQIFSESWALAQVGDTVAARRQLLVALDDIASMSLYTLDEPAQAAGLRRGVLLLAQLARSDDRSSDGRRALIWAERGKAFNSRHSTENKK